MAINEFGCAPLNGRCVSHVADLECSHMCSEGSARADHSWKCDDPPPPIEVAGGHEGDCIGCGKPIHAGDTMRRWEEGSTCGNGCLDDERQWGFH